MNWYYATSTYRDSLLVLECLAAVYFAFRFSETNQTRDTFLSGLFVSFSIFTKPAMVIIVPFISCYVLYHCYRQKNWRAFGAYCAVGALFCALLLFVNYWRFGNIFETGYGDKASVGKGDFWRQVSWFGLSWEKSLFVHNPLLLATIPAMWFFYRRQKSLFLLLLLLSAGFFLWYCSAKPRLNYAWGPRYFIVIMPFLVLPAGFVLMQRKRIWRALIVATFVVGFTVTLVSVLASPREYMSIRRRYLNIELKEVPRAEKPFTPPQITAIFYLLRHKIHDPLPVYRLREFNVYPDAEIDLRKFRYFHGLDIWFVHSEPFGKKFSRVFLIISGVGLVLLLPLIMACGRRVDQLGSGKSRKHANVPGSVSEIHCRRSKSSEAIIEAETIRGK